MIEIMPMDADCRSYAGRRIRITKGSETFTGVVVGCGGSAMAAGPDRTVFSWTMRTSEGDALDFLPSDGWRIFAVE